MNQERIYALWYISDAGYRASEIWFFSFEPTELRGSHTQIEPTGGLIESGGSRAWVAIPSGGSRVGAQLESRQLYHSVDDFRRDRALAKLTPDERKALGY